MLNTKWTSIFVLLGLMSGCATSEDSTLLGAGVGMIIGGGFGAAAGQADDNQVRAGAVGAVTGAAIGGLMGFLQHRDDVSKLAAAKKFGGDGDALPSLSKPIVRKVWIPDRVEGDKFERGHFIYQIDRNSGWNQSDE